MIYSSLVALSNKIYHQSTFRATVECILRYFNFVIFVMQQARAIGPLPSSRRTRESPVALESASLYCDVYVMAFSEMMVTEGLPSPELLPSSR